MIHFMWQECIIGVAAARFIDACLERVYTWDIPWPSRGPIDGPPVGDQVYDQP